MASLFLSACWTQVVRPIVIQVEIRQGCRAFHSVKDFQNPTSPEADAFVKHFSAAARLDPSYIDLAKDATYYYLSTTKKEMTEAAASVVAQGAVSFYSFCS